jgi:hypothetical protein
MFLFVTDEKSALVWLFNFITTPRVIFRIYLLAYNQLANIQGDNIPDLKEMLEQNFIYENGKFRRPKSNAMNTIKLQKKEKKY